MNRIAKRTSGSLSNLNLPGAAGVAAVLNEQQASELAPTAESAPEDETVPEAVSAQ